MREKRDAVIVGGGAAGICCAARLAFNGWKPLVLERDDVIGGRSRVRMFFNVPLDRGIHTVLYGKRCPFVTTIDEVQGEPVDLYEDKEWFHYFRDGQYEPIPISLKSLMDCRFMTPQEKVEFIQLMNWINAIPMEEARKLNDLSVAEWMKDKSPGLQRYIHVTGFWTFTTPRLDWMSAGEWIATFKDMLELDFETINAYPKQGAMNTLFNSLVGTIYRDGGEVRTNSQVTEVVIENGKVKGVKVKDLVQNQDYEVEAPVVVSNIPTPFTFRTMNPKHFPKEFVAQIESYQNKPSCSIGIAALLRKSMIDFKAPVIFHFGKEEDNIMGWFLEMTNLAPHQTPPGTHLFIFAPMVTYEETKDEEKVRYYLEEVDRQLNAFFPEFKDNVIWKLTGVQRLIDAVIKTPGKAGDQRPGPRAPGVEGLFFCGDSAYHTGGLGVGAAANSAKHCAEAILG
jgi:phytoene dehydrogenase-like protein